MKIFSGNGQWVRVRNKAGAETFMQEKRAEGERLDAARNRERAFWAALGHRVRSIWRRIRR
jgi:hypothetical protein